MNEYHKIQTVYKRDPENKHKTLLEGEFSLPEFDYLKNNQWVWTEKVDGTNIRLMWDGVGFGVGGKTDNAQIPSPLYDWIRNNIHGPSFFQTFGTEGGVCLYGEGYGGKIQKAGATYGQQQKFVLFDVKVGDWWLQRRDVEDVAYKMQLDIVPIRGHGTLLEMVEECRNGFLSSWGGFQAEGIVARPTTELRARSGHRMITKIKYKDFVHLT